MISKSPLIKFWWKHEYLNSGALKSKKNHTTFFQQLYECTHFKRYSMLKKKKRYSMLNEFLKLMWICDCNSLRGGKYWGQRKKMAT